MRQSISTVFSLAALAASASLLTSTTAHAQDDGRWQDGHRAEWKSWGGNLNNTHSSLEEHRISTDNVNRLHTKWVFATAGDVSATPTVQGDAVYAVDWGGGIYRVDARTGKAVWSKMLPNITGVSASFARTSPAIAGDKIIIGDQGGGTILALNKATGDLIWKTTVDPLPAAFITNSAVISDGIAYIGVASGEEGMAGTDPNYILKFRGSIQALNVETGAVIWKTYTVPGGYTGGAVWGSNFVIDHKRNSLFATVGNNYSVPVPVAQCLTKAKTLHSEFVCLSTDDYIDSVISLNLADGKVKWDRRLQGADTWQTGCVMSGGLPCPHPAGPDYDLGAGANLITLHKDGDGDRDDRQILGAGQKSGVYWGLNPDNGDIYYGTQVGPGGNYGGVEWGAATDNKRVYVPSTNFAHVSYTLHPTGERWNGGNWAGLDAATGKILWQTKVPGQDPLHLSLPSQALAPVSEANGVVYGGAMSGYMVALEAKSGKILWKFQSGGSVNCAPAIVDGTIYWGSGYANDPTRLGGKGNNKLYAFTLGDHDHDGDGGRRSW